MKNSYKFYNNKDCKYFPCHETIDEDNFNCMFCFCPLHNYEDCGGNYKIIEYENKKIKDCSKCMIPHLENGYEYIMVKLK